MFKPGISANAAHILLAIQHAVPAARVAICEQILSFADLEGQPACIGFKEAFAGEDRAAQIRAANAMTFTGNFAVLHALAENHGHVCIKVDTDAPAGDLAVLELVTHVWAANGNVGAAVDATLADGRVELRELKEVRGAIYRTQQAMLAMLARLEEMAEPKKERTC